MVTTIQPPETAIDARIVKLEQELEQIRQRNWRVEADKAWETSGFRIGTICLATYVVASLLLYLIGCDRFLLNALIPPCGFYLSAQSLPAIKRLWISARFRR